MEKHWEMCYACNGSGEGKADFSICYICKGKGEIFLTDAAEQEDEEPIDESRDDFDFRNDP